MSDDGDLTYILKNGQLIYYDKITKSIYVHGSINCDNFLVHYNTDTRYTDIDDWVNDMNKWASELINKAYSTDNEKDIIELIEYQEPLEGGKDRIKSVVHARPWDSDENSIGLKIPIDTKCMRNIKHFIKYIVISHSPVGQVPVLIKDNDIILVACDTTQAGRIGHITLNKDNVTIKAEYDIRDDNNGKTNYGTPGPCNYNPPKNQNDLINLKYSSNDEYIGMIINDSNDNNKKKLVISKIPENENEYLVCYWTLKPFPTPHYSRITI